MQEMQETQVWALGQEDSLEEEIATHSSILAWIIPRTEPGRLQSVAWVRHDWVTEHMHIFFQVFSAFFPQNKHFKYTVRWNSIQ